VLYENLKDLQFEYHQGKLSDDDYQSLKAGFLYDLAAVMDSIERLQPVKHSVRPHNKSPEKSAPANAAAAERVCPSCGTVNTANNRFCGQCGKVLA